MSFLAGSDVLRLVPPLVITEADVDEMIEKLEKSFCLTDNFYGQHRKCADLLHSYKRVSGLSEMDGPF